MKIIEALKKVKLADLQLTQLGLEIGQNSAFLSYENPPHGNPVAQTAYVQSLLDQVRDLAHYAEKLREQIAYTNVMTKVTIELGGNNITKSLASWINRRRVYAHYEYRAWGALTDRNLPTDRPLPASAGTTPTIATIVRMFSPTVRDQKLREFREEPMKIDAILETVNATTDLLELPTEE